MDILNYTSYDEVRQVIGLSTDELPDTELAAEMYGNSLQLKLREVTLPTIAPGPGPLDTRFMIINEIVEDYRTADEQKLYNLTRLYSTYVVAYDASMSLGMRAPKMVSDGKRSLTRFSPESTYLETARNISSMLDDLKQQIEKIASGVIVTLPLMTAITPIFDPVTNE